MGSGTTIKQPGVTRVKICCIASLEEAWTAIRHGASAVGLVSEMPSGPGVIPEELIAEIAARLPPAVGSFLLTSRQDAAEIIAQQRRCRTAVCGTPHQHHPALRPTLARHVRATAGVHAGRRPGAGGPRDG